MTHSDRPEFACRCGEANRAAADEQLAWAREFLGLASSEWFLSEAVMELMLAWDIDVTGMPVNQWFAVDYRPSLNDPDNPASVGRVQCDRLEDGLALLLRRAFDKWGRARPGTERAADPDSTPPNFRHM